MAAGCVGGVKVGIIQFLWHYSKVLESKWLRYLKRIMNFATITKILFVGFLSLLLPACDGPSHGRDANPFHLPPEGFVGNKATGKALYSQNCLVCHGVGAQGSNQGPPLLDNIYNPRHHADLAFHLAVKNGVRAHHWKFGDMQPMPGISPETVGHIVAYVRDIQRKAGIE